MDESATPPRPPRFPYVAALLCAACISMAAWTWMRYSYASDATLLDLYGDDLAGRVVEGRYVQLRDSQYPSMEKSARRVVRDRDGEIWVDTTASRFHGASVAGLVVGAMGVFVFTVALRHWLNRRRAFHVEKAEGET